jgi:hypothetical protein
VKCPFLALLRARDVNVVVRKYSFADTIWPDRSRRYRALASMQLHALSEINNGRLFALHIRAERLERAADHLTVTLRK